MFCKIGWKFDLQLLKNYKKNLNFSFLEIEVVSTSYTFRIAFALSMNLVSFCTSCWRILFFSLILWKFFTNSFFDVL